MSNSMPIIITIYWTLVLQRSWCTRIQKHVMHMVIPHADDIDEALGKAYSYPPQYDPNGPNYINPVKEKARAIIFRVGDYTLNSCM